ncbi:MAG: hypothetical protein IJC88_06470 [Oscillospiraceae bacterium]|nr:hypothetical protein [Oscillospiraceae bacterium]
MKEIIHTDSAPKAIGPYSQAVKAQGVVFVSGQIPIDPATGLIVEGIEAQARQCFSNVSAILKEAGSDLSKAVKITVYLKTLSDFETVNRIYAEQFSGDFPARCAVGGLEIPKGALIELDVIAES